MDNFRRRYWEILQCVEKSEVRFLLFIVYIVGFESGVNLFVCYGEV